MSYGKDPMAPRRPDTSENPVGTERSIARQREKERHGHFVRVDDRTMIFVRDGEDAKKKIAAFQKQVKNRPIME